MWKPTDIRFEPSSKDPFEVVDDSVTNKKVQLTSAAVKQLKEKVARLTERLAAEQKAREQLKDQMKQEVAKAAQQVSAPPAAPANEVEPAPEPVDQEQVFTDVEERVLTPEGKTGDLYRPSK